MAAQPEGSGRDVLTTGEAAALLKVSRSTISRLFDRGELKGEVNLITGKRRISRHSVMEMLRQCEARRLHASSPSPRRVLLATGRTAFAERMREVADMPPRLALAHTPFGADALIACLRACPDLLIMDGSLDDISGEGIIAALRRQNPTRQLKILCFDDAPVADREPGVVYMPGIDSQDDAVLREHINQVLNVAAPTEAREPRHHRGRRWDRHPVSIPARIGIYPSRAPRQRYWGKAVIRNISRGGALLKGIEMDDGVLTASPFRMLIQTNHPLLQNWQANCQVTRLSCNGDVSAGVQFLRLPEPSRRQLRQLCG